MPSKPEEERLPHHHSIVVQVEVGYQHGLLLTDEGIVYSWGQSNFSGQLGREAKEKECEKPTMISELSKEIVVQVACGKYHCLALTEDGKLFGWGQNRAGQVGKDDYDFAPSASSSSDVPVPYPINVKDPDGTVHFVKACACGPESSACSTTDGQVFVWGAIAHKLFGGAKNCTVPQQLKLPEALVKDRTVVPDRISLHKYSLACTLGRPHFEDELANLVQSLKKRHAHVSEICLHEAKNDIVKAKGRSTEVSDLEQRFAESIAVCKKARDDNAAERRKVEEELKRLSRDLTICDQQDMAFTERAAKLEAEKADSATGPSRTLETKITDINHFRSSNKRTQMQLLNQKGTLERKLLNLSQEEIAKKQEQAQVEARLKMIKSLHRGDSGNRGVSSVDEGLRIADAKRLELAATAPEVLAGKGRFTGLDEVLQISERALHDISSSLKEVRSAAKEEGAILEEVLEANLKLRKEILTLLQEERRKALPEA